MLHLKMKHTIDTPESNRETFEFTEDIELMRRKEITTYKREKNTSLCGLQDEHVSTFSHESSTSSQRSNERRETKDHEGKETSGITASNGIVMCEGCYQVADHFRARRELVEISMNFLDRLLDKFYW